MPSRNFKIAGVKGYVGADAMKRKRRFKRGRRGMLRRKRRFGNRVRKAVETFFLEKSQRHNINPVRVSWNANAQAYGAILVQNSGLDISTIKGKIATSVQSSYAPTSNNVKFTINSYVADITMKNQTQGTVLCDVFELVPRNDMQQSVSSLFAQSFVDQNNTGGDTAYGSDLYQAENVTSNFKIVAKTRYLLAPGSMSTLQYRDKKDYVIDYERVLASTGSAINNATFRKWSRIWFVICRGEPVNDASTKTTVGSLAGAVDFISNETYYYSWAAESQTKTDTNNALASVTTPDSVLIDTGAIINPTVA